MVVVKDEGEVGGDSSREDDWEERRSIQDSEGSLGRSTQL
jgi:hypothetical protein